MVDRKQEQHSKTPGILDFAKIIDSRESGSKKYSDKLLIRKAKRRMKWLARLLGYEDLWWENECFFGQPPGSDDDIDGFGFERIDPTSHIDDEVQRVAWQVKTLYRIVDCM